MPDLNMVSKPHRRDPNCWELDLGVGRRLLKNLETILDTLDTSRAPIATNLLCLRDYDCPERFCYVSRLSQI
jgi:hypothetical protein